jgi:hypothetical protein
MSYYVDQMHQTPITVLLIFKALKHFAINEIITEEYHSLVHSSKPFTKQTLSFKSKHENPRF